MSWVIEWKHYLQEQATADEKKEIANGKTYIPYVYKSLKAQCNKDGLIYQPAMYDEYLKWEDKHKALLHLDHELSPRERILAFTRVSRTMFRQHDELQLIGDYEHQIANLHYCPVSIIERMSLAAAYANR